MKVTTCKYNEDALVITDKENGTALALIKFEKRNNTNELKFKILADDAKIGVDKIKLDKVIFKDENRTI
jgi:hypothetical protein